ncbi:MAG: class I SAM-dependent methyltransferase [Caldilineaceae bacterium]|nr:class I SAM-dependent methyltransferase [Caldilineaceae bacterium]
MQVNEVKLSEFVGKMLGDIGGAFSVGLVRIGEQLGLYKALLESGPMTPHELAMKTRTAERYIREWLAHQAASGYLAYDPDTGEFELPPEQAMVFAVDDSPVNMLGVFDLVIGNLESAPKVQHAFHTGEGVSWGDHTNCLFCAVDKFFRPSYQHNIVEQWLPALDGVIEKLERGARVADIGCGHGSSTVFMAKAFPNSHFFGYDFHDASIAHARDLARREDVEGNVTFEEGLAKNFPGANYDLICMFDCLHDMGDPAGAAAHVLESLADDGTFMVVEPMAGDRLEDNLNPVGRVMYAASTLVCVPTSLAQEVGLALGAQAGEAKLREVIMAGGFGSVRRAAETPFSMVLEARRQ